MVLQQGQVYCGECALTFTAALFSPPLRPAPAAPALEPGAATPCARHARNPAIATCERCGAFMCGLCRTDADGKALCMPCFERLRGDGAIADTRTTFKSWRTLGLHLGVLGLLLSPVGLILGPASLVASARGVAQVRRGEEAGGAAGTVTAFVLGMLSTLFGLVMALMLAKAFGK